jgi:hypothetical protein
MEEASRNGKREGDTRGREIPERKEEVSKNKRGEMP